jgi:hypothetical protein
LCSMLLGKILAKEKGLIDLPMIPGVRVIVWSPWVKDLTVSCNRKITFSLCSMLLGKIFICEKGLVNSLMIQEGRVLSCWFIQKGKRSSHCVVQLKYHVLFMFYDPW